LTPARQVETGIAGGRRVGVIGVVVGVVELERSIGASEL
jgi:hypothetical protein